MKLKQSKHDELMKKYGYANSNPVDIVTFMDGDDMIVIHKFENGYEEHETIYPDGTGSICIYRTKKVVREGKEYEETEHCNTIFFTSPDRFGYEMTRGLVEGKVRIGEIIREGKEREKELEKSSKSFVNEVVEEINHETYAYRALYGRHIGTKNRFSTEDVGNLFIQKNRYENGYEETQMLLDDSRLILSINKEGEEKDSKVIDKYAGKNAHKNIRAYLSRLSKEGRKPGNETILEMIILGSQRPQRKVRKLRRLKKIRAEDGGENLEN